MNWVYPTSTEPGSTVAAEGAGEMTCRRSDAKAAQKPAIPAKTQPIPMRHPRHADPEFN
jgi:hypothetical protein